MKKNSKMSYQTKSLVCACLHLNRMFSIINCLAVSEKFRMIFFQGRAQRRVQKKNVLSCRIALS